MQRVPFTESRGGPPVRGPHALVAASAGTGAVLAGVGLVAAGLWGRREVRTALARERIVVPGAAGAARAPLADGKAARALAELIRKNTLDAADGRTYGEVDLYVDADGNGTSDRARALVDERTGEPVEHPDHALWLQSTTLQTALMQAYVGSRLAELTIGLGAAFVTVGAGLAAAGRSRR